MHNIVTCNIKVHTYETNLKIFSNSHDISFQYLVCIIYIGENCFNS